MSHVYYARELWSLTGYFGQMLVPAETVLQLENQFNHPLGNFFWVDKSPDGEEQAQ